MSPENGKVAINRLCSEIQLFDLCDLDSCNFRIGRFCSDNKLLARFESIKEEDDRPPIVYDDEELDDDPDLLHDYEVFGTDESEDE